MKKIIMLLTVSILVVLLLSTSALGYIDPSIMTYIIQVVAGLAIAIGAGVAIYFHKIKKKVNKTLNIDENANKEVEEDVVMINEKEDI